MFEYKEADALIMGSLENGKMLAYEDILDQFNYLVNHLDYFKAYLETSIQKAKNNHDAVWEEFHNVSK